MSTLDRSDPAAEALGITVSMVDPGSAVVSLTVGPAMLNVHDICHGGVIFTLADTALYHASNSHGFDAVASGCDINFLRPAVAGSVLTAIARERNRSRRQALYDVEVRDQEGRLIATLTGRTTVVERRGS